MRFQTMAHDANAAMLTCWRQRENRAFETIEDVRDAVHDDFKGFVVIVSAGFTFGHDDSLMRCLRRCAFALLRLCVQRLIAAQQTA